MKVHVEKPTSHKLDELGVRQWPIWEKEESSFDWHYDSQEVCYFLEGEVEVELPDGSKHMLHFKELPAVEFRKFQMAENSEDDEVRASSIAKLIAMSLVEPDGKPALTIKEAVKLNSAAANAIMAAILDINGFGKHAKND